jgi:hypothetical protein
MQNAGIASEFVESEAGVIQETAIGELKGSRN